MKFDSALEHFNLEMDASGIGLGAGLLQVTEGMNCEHDKVPGNAAFHPTALTSESLSSVEQ